MTTTKYGRAPVDIHPQRAVVNRAIRALAEDMAREGLTWGSIRPVSKMRLGAVPITTGWQDSGDWYDPPTEVVEYISAADWDRLLDFASLQIESGRDDWEWCA